MKVLNHEDTFYFIFKDIAMEMTAEVVNKSFGLIVDDTIFNFKKQPSQRI